MVNSFEQKKSGVEVLTLHLVACFINVHHLQKIAFIDVTLKEFRVVQDCHGLSRDVLRTNHSPSPTPSPTHPLPLSQLLALALPLGHPMAVRGSTRSNTSVASIKILPPRVVCTKVPMI